MVIVKNVLFCLFVSLLSATISQYSVFAIDATEDEISARPNLESECRDLFKPGGELPSGLSNTEENSVQFSYVCTIKYPEIVAASLNNNVNGTGDGDMWDIFKNSFGAGKSVQDIIKVVVNLLLYLTGTVAVIMVIFSGYQFVTAAGDVDKVKKAKGALLYSVIGIVIVTLAYTIVNFVLGLFK